MKAACVRGIKCVIFPSPLGAVCYATCTVALDMDLRDPVVLPNGSWPDSVKHWMLPTRVQVDGTCEWGSP